MIANEDTVVSELSITDFLEIIGGTLEDMTFKNEKSHEKKMTSFVNKAGHPANSIKLEDLICIKKLGKIVNFDRNPYFIKILGFGQFGSVYLVRPKNGKDLYALKCVSKKQVLEQKLDKHLQATNFLNKKFKTLVLLARTHSPNLSEFPFYHGFYTNLQR